MVIFSVGGFFLDKQLALGGDFANGRLHCGAAQMLVRFKGYLGRYILVFAMPADVSVLVLFALAPGSVAWASWASAALLVQGMFWFWSWWASCCCTSSRQLG